MKSSAFYTSLLSFFAGVFVASLAPASFAWLASIFVIVCSAALLLRMQGRKIPFAIILFSVLAFTLGAARMNVFSQNDHPLDVEIGEKAILPGFVCDEPRRKETTQSFCFSLEGGGDRILVTTGRYPEREYGEILSLEGKLAFPKNFESYEGGPEFDYVSYLAKDGIRYTMFRPEIQKQGDGAGNPLVRALFYVKAAFVEKIREFFPEPESSLLSGLLLGDRSSLPKDVTEEFKVAGLVHILVLSGYNVTIVAESLMKAFSFLPRTFGRGAGVVSIVFFALMTGASATTVRASIMALIVILARSSSRRYDITRALLIAAFLMILHNPAILAFDVSFQLSFLATLALIYVSPLVEERLSWVTERWNIREILSTTIATQLFVFPFLAYTMGQISLISLATNILVLPLVPYTMLLGFVSSSLGFVSSFLAAPLAWISSAALSYILSVASVFARVPFASVHIKTSTFMLVFIYILYALYLIRAWRRRNCSQQSAN